MEYRSIGRTGLSASVIGLGAEHLDKKPYAVVEETVHAALEQGVNIIDVFMPGDEVRGHIAKALGAKRKDVLIQGHIGSVSKNGQYDISRDLDTCKQGFEGYLQSMGTDYIDLGMLFFIDTPADLKSVMDGGILQYAQDLKQRGTIRGIGASSHNPLIARQLVEAGVLDVLLFSINAAFDQTPAAESVLERLGGDLAAAAYERIDPDRMALYRLCESMGVGITVMKTFGAGKLLSPEHTPFGAPMTVGQCIHYALTRPGVVSAMVGCTSRAQVLEAVGYLGLTDRERDYTEVLAGGGNSMSGSCVYCGHCHPCPVEIDIAAVNKYLDIALLDTGNIPPSIRQHYRSLSARGSDCIACGSCEARCPFAVPVIARMEQAKELLEA